MNKAKQVIELYRFSSFTIREIARQCDLSEHSTLNIIHHYLDLMQKRNQSKVEITLGIKPEVIC